MKRLGVMMKAVLVVWMLSQPTLYFFLAAAPERGGIFARLPETVYRMHEYLTPLFTRKAAL